MDGETEKAIFENLLGRNGLLRRLKATIVLVSNSSKYSHSRIQRSLIDVRAAQYFQDADHIVVLGDRGIKEQGAWQDIKIKAASIAKFSSNRQSNNDPMLSSGFDKLSAQVRAKDEAAADLARRTGDLALYGTAPVSFVGNG